MTSTGSLVTRVGSELQDKAHVAAILSCSPAEGVLLPLLSASMTPSLN